MEDRAAGGAAVPPAAAGGAQRSGEGAAPSGSDDEYSSGGGPSAGWPPNQLEGHWPGDTSSEDVSDGESSSEHEGDSDEDSSSEDDEQQQAVYAHLEAATADAFFPAAPAAHYRLPTRCCHFQSADALAVSAPDEDGSLLVAATDDYGVSLHRLPGAGAVPGGGGAQPAPRRLGGFQSLGDVFSMALSQDGRLLATGGENGLLALYVVDPHAPPRPGPAAVNAFVPHTFGQNYFYTPLAAPPPQAGAPVAALPPSSQGLLHDECELSPEDLAGLLLACGANLHIRRLAPLFSSAAYLWFVISLAYQSPEALAPAAPAPPPHPAPGWQEALALPHNLALLFAGLASHTQWMHDHDPQLSREAAEVGRACQQHAERAAEDADAADGAPQARPAQASAPRGAVALGCALGLGLPSAQAALHRGLEPEGMVNGVRFGLVGGRERLLAAEQSGWVYVLEAPPSGCQLAALPDALMCSGLGEPSAHWSMRAVNAFAAGEHPLGVSLGRRALARTTAALGPFGCPLNMAAPSPDGRYVAVVGDAAKAFLVDQGAGFAWRELPFALRRPAAAPEVGEGVAVGSQYCAWNASSSLLALSSDALHAVVVFDPGAAAPVLLVEQLHGPVLPVSFAPWDDQCVVFAEEGKRVHVRAARGPPAEQFFLEDAVAPREGMQLLRVPIAAPGARRPRRRITGMAATRHGDLLVATNQGLLFRFLARLPWSQERHRLWPPACREAVQALLLSAARLARDAAGGAEAGLQRTDLGALPVAVLHAVAGHLAGSRASWGATLLHAV